MSIAIRGLAKRFGAFQALHPLDLDIGDGELVALLGPSGCGKTTLLRLIAGLEAADAGEVRFSGEDVAAVPVRERRVGFVFQHYALFRHLSVFENVAFGLRVRPRRERPPEAALRAEVERMLALVHLEGLARRFPDQLSGGQRQRVALARALVIAPRVLLLDEPFGALDAQVRRELRRWLRRLHDDMKITTVFVTHDQDEALDVADRIVVLRGGRIEQAGTPKALYDAPETPFVHEFLGEANRLAGAVGPGGVHFAGATLPAPAGTRVPPGAVDVCVRPHDLRIVAGGTPGAIATRLVEVRDRGVHARLELRTAHDDVAIAADVDPALAASIDRRAAVYVAPVRIAVYPRGAGSAALVTP